MSTSARFTGAKNTENTSAALANDFQQPVFASTIALAIKIGMANTLVQPATLTGAVTFTANVGTTTTPPFVGDTIEMLLTPDATTRVVTFGTGFVPNGTLSVTTAKFAFINFMFNGTAWQEISRTVTA